MAAYPTLGQDEEFAFEGVDRKILVEVSWDIMEGCPTVDVDAAAVMFNDFGAPDDAVFYNQLKSRDGSLRHSGDSTDGAADGVDEWISIDLATVPLETRAIMIVASCYEGGNFRDVETASLRLRETLTAGGFEGGADIMSMSLAANGNHQSLIIGMIYRNDDGAWVVRNVHTPAEGANWNDCLSEMREVLSVIIDADLLAEGAAWNNGHVFELEKGLVVDLPEMEDIRVGLAWDTTSAVDLDVSAVLYSYAGNVTEAVFYNNLQTSTQSVTHSGDNQDGDGDGDDEFVLVSVPKLQDNVAAIVFVITCFSQGDFSAVTRARASISDFLNGRELVTMSLPCTGGHTAFVLGALYRPAPGADMTVINIGEATNGRTFEDTDPFIRSFFGHLIPIVPRDGPSEVLSAGGPSYNMTKGEAVGLSAGLTSVRIGLGWDTRLDLDGSVILMSGLEVDAIVKFGHLTEPGVRHSGDNTTGAGSGDDETIDITFASLKSNITAMYVTVNVYTSGKRFNEVHGAYVRLLTGSDELCKYNLRDEPSFSSTSAMFFARLSKSSPSSGWELEALGEAGNNPDARTANDLKESAKALEAQNPEMQAVAARMAAIAEATNRREAAQRRVQEVKRKREAAREKRKLEQATRRFAALGTSVTVVVESASGLMAADKNGLSDPLVVCSAAGGKEHKTDKVKKTLDPVWEGETFTWSPIPGNINFDLQDWDRFSSNDPLGSAVFDIYNDVSLTTGGPHSRALPISTQGVLNISVTFS